MSKCRYLWVCMWYDTIPTAIPRMISRSAPRSKVCLDLLRTLIAAESFLSTAEIHILRRWLPLNSPYDLSGQILGSCYHCTSCEHQAPPGARSYSLLQTAPAPDSLWVLSMLSAVKPLTHTATILARAFRTADTAIFPSFLTWLTYRHMPPHALHRPHIMRTSSLAPEVLPADPQTVHKKARLFHLTLFP